MVSVAATQNDAQSRLDAALTPEDCTRLQDALAFVEPLYQGHTIATGQDAFVFVQGVALTLATLNTDADTRIAALLVELPALDAEAGETIAARFGSGVAGLVAGIRQLMRLHDQAFGYQDVGRGKNAAQQAAEQLETLRKMLLSMASDMRVVLVRLASRVTTLRYFAEIKRSDEATVAYARETLDLYAPLANRLGVWQLKWELEDLAFRFLEPDTYKRIAGMLEEKRLERESFIEKAIARLKSELAAIGIEAEVYGRPKHIYSIWNKMRGKSLDFSELRDVRAFRVIVDDVKTCYAVLSLVHDLWTPIPEEFDDYIARPKPNGYQSLHTAVLAEDGRAFEVQIRTQEMHRFAEYGVASHWRYKESGGSNFAAQKYDEKIAWLRQLLAWKTDVAGTMVGQEEVQREWVRKLQSTTLDDRIYVMTPQARVIELPNGATPIDFAYHLHTDVGHRCRGARVDGSMVPLNTPLKNGQTVEIITVRGGTANVGPSRDWLTPGYTASARTRAKVRAWFNAIDQQETLARGRATVEKTLQREGKTAINLEELAHRLGFAKVDELFLAVGKDELSVRLIEQALHADEAQKQGEKEVSEPLIPTSKSRPTSVAQGRQSGVLVVGTQGLLTQLARCCKPAPPDDIVGFITRGKGVSIHRTNCKNLAQMRLKAGERVIQTTWGEAGKDTVYPVDVFILASDRQGLLRDISEVFSREKINVTGVSTQSTKGQARMSFTVEVPSTAQLQRALAMLNEVGGVLEVQRL